MISKLTKRYRIVLEESWKAERPEVRSPDKHWYEQIPCRGEAFIGLYSEAPPTLQLYTPRVGNAKNIWREIGDKPDCRADFHMDGEAVLYFPPGLLDVAADLADARRKRTRNLTPEQREKLIEMGKAHRFKGKAHGDTGPKSDPRRGADGPGKG